VRVGKREKKSHRGKKGEKGRGEGERKSFAWCSLSLSFPRRSRGDAGEKGILSEEKEKKRGTRLRTIAATISSVSSNPHGAGLPMWRLREKKRKEPEKKKEGGKNPRSDSRCWAASNLIFLRGSGSGVGRKRKKENRGKEEGEKKNDSQE